MMASRLNSMWDDKIYYFMSRSCSKVASYIIVWLLEMPVLRMNINTIITIVEKKKKKKLPTGENVCLRILRKVLSPSPCRGSCPASLSARTETQPP